MRFIPSLLLLILLWPFTLPAQAQPDRRFPLFAYLTTLPSPTLITYTPSELDPRQEANQRRLRTSSIRADLEVLRPHFDGLVLYGYHEACTPRILGVAKDLKFRAVLLGIWDPKSAAELDGVAELAKLHQDDFALGVIVGNEGLTFKRYETEDLTLAAARLRRKLPATVPLATGEPLVGYQQAFVRQFGDFLTPNIHPVFDRRQLKGEAAAAWAREQALALAVQASKPVLLKETGFPHAGQAAYTPATQQAFWSAYLKPGLLVRPEKNPQAWCYFGIAFDAFDLPWKSQESKLAIEQSWGLFSQRREPYPALEPWRAVRRPGK